MVVSSVWFDYYFTARPALTASGYVLCVPPMTDQVKLALSRTASPHPNGLASKHSNALLA